MLISFVLPFLNVSYIVSCAEEEWEKELEAELQDYEVVTEGNSKLDNVKNDFWEKDIEAMLDEGDLK